MNYTTLVESLKDYMIRYDPPFVTQIPNFIQQGIIRIYNNTKDEGFEKFLTPANTGIGNRTVIKPNDWLETLSFNLTPLVGGDSFFLLPRSYQFCRNYWPNRLNTAPPKFYCDVNTINQAALQTQFYQKWELVPTPDAVYTINIVYAGTPNFNNAAGTNFLTERYPNLLLFSCLIECCLFLDNEEKRVKYDAMYKEELASVMAINTGRFDDKTVNRDKK